MQFIFNLLFFWVKIVNLFDLLKLTRIIFVGYVHDCHPKAILQQSLIDRGFMSNQLIDIKVILL